VTYFGGPEGERRQGHQRQTESEVPQVALVVHDALELVVQPVEDICRHVHGNRQTAGQPQRPLRRAGLARSCPGPLLSQVLAAGHQVPYHRHRSIGWGAGTCGTGLRRSPRRQRSGIPPAPAHRARSRQEHRQWHGDIAVNAGFQDVNVRITDAVTSVWPARRSWGGTQ
jgi:hypothetical protein